MPTTVWTVEASGSGVVSKVFENRASLVDAVSSGFSPDAGTVVFADGLSYLGQTGATAIPDLPGLVPAGDWTPDHFGPRTSASINAAIQAAAAASRGKVVLKGADTTYSISAPILLNQPITLEAEDGRGLPVLTVTGTIADVFTISNRRASVTGVRVNGADLATNFVNILDSTDANASIRIENCHVEGCARFVNIANADGVSVVGNISIGCSLQWIRLEGGGLNSLISDNYHLGFTSGGDGLLVASGALPTEGLIVSSNIVLTPGGRGLEMQQGLCIRFSENVWDQFETGGALLAPTVALTDVAFSGDWFGPRSASTGVPAVKLTGNNNDIRFNGVTAITRAAAIVWVDGAANQNIKLDGCRLRSPDTTSATIGFQNDSGKACVVENTTFDLSGSAINIVEASDATTVFIGNRYSVAMASSTISPLSWMPYSYGFGAGATSGAHSLYLGNGSATDPSLAFQSNVLAGVNTGWYPVTNGWAFAQNGAEVVRIDNLGVQIQRTDAIRGNAANIVDDGFTSFAPASTTGKVLVSLDEASCEFRFRVGSGAACVISEASPASIFAATTGALSGTTGADNLITVAAHTDGLLYIENRRGSTKAIRVSVRY